MIFGLRYSRPLLVAGALIALSGCTTLGLGEDEQAVEEEDVNPVRQALAAGGSVDDANRALERNDYARAYDILRQHLVLNPTDDAAKLAMARVYVGRSEGRNAQTILNSLSDESKGSAQAHLLRGLALLVLDQRADSMVELERALELDPDLWQAANGLGLIYDFDQRWEEAEASYKLALEKKSDSAVVHNNLGYSYLLQGRVDDATKSFSTSLVHDPTLAVARSNLRLALAAKGRYTDAVAGTERSQLPQVLNNIGFVAMMRRDYESASAFFQRAIDESPVYYDAAEENLERLQAITGKPVDRNPLVRGIGN